jgi:S-adenosylmethionine:tRNA ribosyltransferase-isomerase
MQAADFDYHLPCSQIAQEPLHARSDSRLLRLDGCAGEPQDSVFRELPRLLRPGDLLVVNDTQVIPARLRGHKDSGGRVEVLLERVEGDQALVQIRASKAPRTGSELVLGEGARLRVQGREGSFFRVSAEGHEELMSVFQHWGRAPLPPYIRREADDRDSSRYQTVYARVPGAVAAPTAGLHFDAELLAALDQRGVSRAAVTLHVGAGTFQPLREAEVEANVLHAERVEVDESLLEAIAATRQSGGRVVAVGTTVVRALEAAATTGTLRPLRGETQIFLYPGCRFRVIDLLITNLHLPRSSLLMLVCAFGGYQRVMSAYREAVRQGYRFFSYGDAMLVSPGVATDLPPSAPV